MALNIPVTRGTFTRDFLDGAGSLNLTTSSGSFDPTLPFTDGLKQILNASASGDGKLKFGSDQGLAFDATFGAQADNSIRVVWPSDVTDSLLRQYARSLQPNEVGLLLAMDGKAAGTVTGAFPAGPASLSFGIKAGAAVAYERFCAYQNDTDAMTCLTELIGGVRLPQNCNTVDRIPAPGEILAFRYDGFLELSAASTWGYQITGMKGIEFRDLDAVVSYALRLKAGVTAGYRIGGSFAVETSAGSRDGWVRLKVRKNRSSQFDFAAAFDAEGEIHLDGLPETADEFLLAFFGSDARSVLDVFGRIRTLSDPEELEKFTSKILLDSIKSLQNKWLPMGLDSSPVERVPAVAQDVVQEYEQARQKFGNTVDSALDLYEDYLRRDDVGRLREALEAAAELDSPEALRHLSPDSPAWDILERLAGANLFRLLVDTATFHRAVEAARFTLDFVNGTRLERVRDIVDQIVQDFPLNDVFDRLNTFATKEGLRNLADTRLQGVVEKLLGKAWAQIHEHTDKHAAELRRTLDNIETFKNTWFHRLKAAANQSFALSVNASYSRASFHEALIDVEIDLSTTDGRALFDLAAGGKLSQVLNRANLRSVVVNEGILTHELKESTQIQIAVFGWSFKRLVELVSKTEFSIDARPTGLVELFTTEVAIKQREERTGRDKIKEVLESNMLMRLTGEVFRPDDEQTTETRERKRALARVLSRMGASYTFFASDDLTTAEELTDYLGLGEMLGLVASAREFTADLQGQFPNGFGKVTAQYVVTYDDEGIRDAFSHSSGEALREMVKATCRQLAGAALTASRKRHLATLGFAYLDPANARRFYNGGFTMLRDDSTPVLLPRRWTRGSAEVVQMPARSVPRQALISLFHKENDLADALVDLDELIDRARNNRVPVTVDQLEKATRRFLDNAASVDGWVGMNTFFGIFDRFIHEGGSGKRRRDSSLILEIEPSVPTSRVRKFLCAPPAARLPREQTARSHGDVRLGATAT